MEVCHAQDHDLYGLMEHFIFTQVIKPTYLHLIVDLLGHK